MFAAVLVLTATTIGVFSVSNFSPPYAMTKGSALANCKSTPGGTTVVADNHGYNDSISHGAPSAPWPVVNVRHGDLVTLTFCNTDSVEAHGFAVDSYFNRGVILAPGTAYQISFTATQPGSFRIFCTNFCTVHKYMSGRLVVS